MGFKFLTSSFRKIQSLVQPSSHLPIPHFWRAYTMRNCATFSNGLVKVQIDERPANFDPNWLRENCQCPDCFTHSTNQRNVLFHHTDTGISSVKQSDRQLHVNWKDGHASTYDLTQLKQLANPSKPPTRKLWNRDIKIKDVDVKPVAYDKFMKTDDAVGELLKNVWTYGFGVVEGTPINNEAMEMVTRVSFVQETLFGGIWKFTANMARGDTAYTNMALGAHTDNTYFVSPAGIQVFHCLHHDEEGGETLLVDGFNAAEQLRSQDPEAFNLLASTPILHHYKEPGVHIESYHNILNLNPSDRSTLESIRYNHYDRAPTTAPLSQQQLAPFYRALESLSHLIESQDAEYWIKLRPGTVLFIDNWRVLHGRAAFTGNRTMIGCYLPRDDWLSRARTLGVL